METKDIDEYLKRMRATQDKDEQIEITRAFFEKLKEWLIEEESYTVSYLRNEENQSELCQYLFDSGAFDICFDTGYDSIPNLARNLKCLVINYKLLQINIDQEKYTKKLFSMYKDLLHSGKLLDDDGNVRDFDFFDDIVAQFSGLYRRQKLPYDNDIKEVLKKFSENIPEERLFVDSKVGIMAHYSNDYEIYNYIQTMPEEEYINALVSEESKFLENGKPKDIKQYDSLLYEYLMFYGRKRFPLENAEKPYRMLIEKTPVGKLSKLNTYKDFLLKSVESDELYQEDIERLLLGYRDSIIRDILERLHENEDNIEQSSCSDYEYRLFEYYMDNYVDSNKWLDEIANGLKETEELTEEVQRNIELERIKYNSKGGKVTINGNLTDYMTQIYGDEELNGAVQYVIRIQNIFKKRNRPGGNMGKIYDYISSIDTVNLLKENIDVNKIKDGKKDYLKNLDTALSFLCESDFSEATKVFSNPQIINALSQAGVNIYDTRAMDKYVQVYVENSFEGQKSSTVVETIIGEYVRAKASKKDFNLLKEQGMSDLFQMSTTGRTNTNFIKLMYQEMINAKNYIKSGYAKDFSEKYIEEFAQIPIYTERRFDEFIKCLSILKFINGGTLERKYIDFIFSQAMNDESVLNRNREKYGFLVERAIEDLGKIDFKDQNNGAEPTYIYITRSYLEHENEGGQHSQSDKIITMKKRWIDKLYDGKVYSINTVFHENQHMKQHIDFKETMPTSFVKYNMLKENILINELQGYYQRNYENTYIEIEAREKAAERAAEYLARIMPERRIDVATEDLAEDFFEIFASKLEKEQERMQIEAKKEAKLYEGANIKVNDKEEKQSINDIFNANISKYTIQRLFKEYPALEIEFNQSGNRKSFSEMLKFAEVNNLDLSMMMHIIRESKSMEQGDAQETLNSIIGYINQNSKNIEKMDFLRKVLIGNLEGFTSKLSKDFRANHLYSKSIRDSEVRLYNTINNIIDTAMKEGTWCEWLFNKYKCEGKDYYPLQCLQDYIRQVDEKIPTMKTYAKVVRDRERSIQAQQTQNTVPKKPEQKPKKKGSFLGGIFGKKSYKDLKKVSDNSDIEGKKSVVQYEKRLEKNGINNVK